VTVYLEGIVIIARDGLMYGHSEWLGRIIKELTHTSREDTTGRNFEGVIVFGELDDVRAIRRC